MNRYVICTGFFARPEDMDKAGKFFRVWYANTYRYSKPDRVIVLANGGSHSIGAPGEWIHLGGNLGHAHDLSSGRKPHEMCGWSAALVTLAMIAYSDESDFVFKEGDCLAFGPWVERMYSEIGTRGMIFGDNKRFACSQSLILIKHAFIPEFVRLYMAEGSEQLKANECECKFKRMEMKRPDLFGRFSFPFDRDRPLNYDLDVWYSQQNTPEELAEMKRRGLI